jgi:hypothetical protein
MSASMAGDPEHPSAAGTDQDRRVRLLELHHPTILVSPVWLV